MQPRIYFVFAHPNRHRSRANWRVVERVRDLPQVTLVDLYEVYPRFHVDVRHEQAQLRRHDILVFQHPLYWYSLPPLLKLWIDEVFELGVAYGEGERILAGKRFQLSITTGGGPESYAPDGLHEHPLDDFLLPVVETARLCRMEWQPPLVLHGAGRADEAQLEAHAERVRDRMLHLTNPLYGEPGDA